MVVGGVWLGVVVPVAGECSTASARGSGWWSRTVPASATGPVPDGAGEERVEAAALDDGISETAYHGVAVGLGAVAGFCTLGYLARPYTVYRSRDAELGSRPTRPGWERVR